MSDERSVSLGQKLLQFLLRAAPKHLLDDILGEEGGQRAAAYQAEQLKRSAHWPKT